MKEIEAIRAALPAATCGPWIGAGPSHGDPLPRYLDCVVQEDDTDDDCAIAICRDVEPSDVEYITACNPAAMAAVLAHIEEQAAELAAYETAVAEYRQQCLDNYAAVQITEARHLEELLAYQIRVDRLEAELAQRGKIVAWGMPRPDGTIIDAIDPDEHGRKEGSYTVPLYTAPQPPQPERQPDCRTCQRFISQGDGCTTVATCVSGDQYKPTTPIYFWKKP